jgi:D-amino peptidase
MKVIIGTDLEGVAGVVSFKLQTYEDTKYYEAAKKLLTAEVNAAVEALVGLGVDDILVEDGHGCGGIAFEDLHPAAKLLHGVPRGTPEVHLEAVQPYDVVMIVGQHAMAGVATGNMNHTQSSLSIDYYKLNGRPIGELAQYALYHGALGQPLIFVSGDEAACAEAEELLPGITTAAVKKGLGRNCAISLSATASRRRIREAVALAVKRQVESPQPPFTLPGPYMLEKRYFHTDVADAAAQHRLAERVDSQTVRLYSDDILDVIYA